MIELATAVVLILLNGVFSLSELAIVSSRRPRLKAMSEQKRAGARAALALSEEPGRFLSTVQIGITLVGVLAGAFSGSALGGRLTGLLLARGVPEAWAEPLGYGLVIGTITYLSVVVGELVPKTLALRNPEWIACRVAPAMRLVSRIAAPLVWLLDASTRALFRLAGQGSSAASAVTDEDVRALVAEAATTGLIEGDEHAMIAGVLRLGDRSVRAVMTPRTEVEAVNLEEGDAAIRARLLATRRSRLPAFAGDPDHVLGVLVLRDLVPPLLRGEAPDWRAFLRDVPVVPDTVAALDALATLRGAPVPMALIHDEYGNFEGLVTPADILDAIAGTFEADLGAAEEEMRQRADGSWLIDGAMPADELADRLGLALPDRRDYQTVAGLVLAALGHLPGTGEAVDALGWRWEVVDLDGRRIDKVLASRLDRAAED